MASKRDRVGWRPFLCRPAIAKEFMSQSGWYHDRAAECDRMALASRSQDARSRHINDRDRWREIAASIDAAEQAVKERKRRGE
jgi:hypothetical protein